MKTQIRLRIAVRMKKLCITGYPNCTQRRFWSACANAQADLNLRWVHIFEDTFFNATAQLVLGWHCCLPIQIAFCSGDWIQLVDFPPVIARETIFVTSLLFSYTSINFWKEFYLERRAFASDMVNIFPIKLDLLCRNAENNSGRATTTHPHPNSESVRVRSTVLTSISICSQPSHK